MHESELLKEISTAELVELARKARENAHAPYSKFNVGAAVLARDGRVFTGCNIENSSYGLTICAERVALVKALSEGAVDFIKIAVIADTRTPVPPCGACRQVILELCGKDAIVVMANLKGDIESRGITDLLPAPFDRSYL